MKTEIERNFLVIDSAFKDQAKSNRHILQGYLCENPDERLGYVFQIKKLA